MIRKFFQVVLWLCFCGLPYHMVSVLNWARAATKSENNNNNNNLFLTRRKLTSEYDQMRLTTITACDNYNKVYLRIPKNL